MSTGEEQDDSNNKKEEDNNNNNGDNSSIDYSKCVGCQLCKLVCPTLAITRAVKRTLINEKAKSDWKIILFLTNSVLLSQNNSCFWYNYCV